MSNKTKFSDLPAEVRLMIWPAALECIPGRKIMIEFIKHWKPLIPNHFVAAWVDGYSDPPYAAGPKCYSNLLRVNRECRDALKGKYNHDDWVGEIFPIIDPSTEEIMPTWPAPYDISVNFAIDTIKIDAAPGFDWFEYILREDEAATSYALRNIFSHIFWEEADKVALNVVHLELGCGMSKFCGLVPQNEAGDSDSEESKSENLAKFKARFPSLKRLHIQCNCRPKSCSYSYKIPSNQNLVTVQWFDAPVVTGSFAISEEEVKRVTEKFEKFEEEDRRLRSIGWL